MKLSFAITFPILMLATFSSCQKTTYKKVKGLDGTSNWHGYNTVDRYYQYAQGGDSSARHDTTFVADRSFALSITSNTQIRYNNQFFTLASSSDSLKVYSFDAPVSGTTSQHADILYYVKQDSIIIATVLTLDATDTTPSLIDKYYSHLATF